VLGKHAIIDSGLAKWAGHQSPYGGLWMPWPMPGRGGFTLI